MTFNIKHELKLDIHVLTCQAIPNFYLAGRDLAMLKRDIEPVIRFLRCLTKESNCNWIMLEKY